jgi:hypothetical protein
VGNAVTGNSQCSQGYKCYPVTKGRKVKPMQDIMAYVEELTRRAAKRKPPAVQPTIPPMSDREAALAFCNAAAARLVAACPLCFPDTQDAAYLVLVPLENDSPEFRRALEVLRIPYPIITRHDPLAHLPARCQHVQEAQ